MARNMVIAGDYKEYRIKVGFGKPRISISYGQDVELTKETIASYEVITEDKRKSISSGLARGLLGGALLGPAGMLAGGMSAKNKGEMTVAILFQDGKKSLIEVEEGIYKEIVRNMF